MKLICLSNIDAYSNEDGRLFTKDKIYEFVNVDNRFTKIHKFVGYIEKDDEGYKRWLSESFKQESFNEI